MSRGRVALIAAGVAPAVFMLFLSVGRAAATSGTGGSHAPKTPIQHLVVVMQENHTFDNYFGTYPGADGIPAGAAMPVNPAKGPQPAVRPFHIGDRSIKDLSHTVQSATIALNGGRMNGFVRAQNLVGSSGTQSMGHYDGTDVPFYWNVADRYVLFDHFFTSALGGSFMNHVYWVAGGPGNATQTVPAGGLRVTTIFDRLQKAGVSWKFYIENYDPSITYRTLTRTMNANRASQATWCPLLDIARFIDNPALRSHIVDLSQYYTDLRDGTLPQVSYIVPSGSSEHPPGSLKAGQRKVGGLVNALIGSRAWKSSAFMVSYDDWGGWYDHVRPPKRDMNGDGFRAPALLVSPYARAHFIDHTTLDFTSILKFIEQNWNVAPLSRLDATAGSMMGAFDFSQPPRPASVIPLDRTAASPPASTGRKAILYPAYAVVGVISLTLIAWALFRPTRRPASGSLHWDGGS